MLRGGGEAFRGQPGLFPHRLPRSNTRVPESILHVAILVTGKRYGLIYRKTDLRLRQKKLAHRDDWTAHALTPKGMEELKDFLCPLLCFIFTEVRSLLRSTCRVTADSQ